MENAALPDSLPSMRVPMPPTDPPLLVASPPIAPREPRDVSVHGDSAHRRLLLAARARQPRVLAHLRAENAHADAWFKPLADSRTGSTGDAGAHPAGRRGGAVPQGRLLVFEPHRDRQAVPATCVAGRPRAPRRPRAGLARPERAGARQALSAERRRRGQPRRPALAYRSTRPAGSISRSTSRTSTTAPSPLKIRPPRASADGRTTAEPSSTPRRTRPSGEQGLATHVGRRRPDTLVYEDRNELFWVDLGKTRDDRYIVIGSDSNDTSEIRVIDAARPAMRSRQRVVLPRKGREGSPRPPYRPLLPACQRHRAQLQARRCRRRNPRSARATELIAHRADVMIEDVDLFAHHMVVSERDRGVQKLRVWDLATAASTTSPSTRRCTRPPAPATPNSTPRASASTSPRSSRQQRLRLRHGAAREPEETPAGARLRPRALRIVQIQARAGDGTLVPVSLVWRKDRARAGRSRCCSRATAPTASATTSTSLPPT